MKKARITSGMASVFILSMGLGLIFPVTANADTTTENSNASNPDDPLFSNQWALQAEHLDLSAVWGKTTGVGQTIAILDSGITKHEDLDKNVIPGYDMVSNINYSGDGDGRDSNPEDPGTYTIDDSRHCRLPAIVARNSDWHGTSVASVAAASGNDGKGMTGVAPDAKILPIRVTDRCSDLNSSDLANGIRWAVGDEQTGSIPVDVSPNKNPATVISISLFKKNFDDTNEIAACPIEVQAAINYANSKNVPIVVGAGNDTMSASIGWPANCENVIVVAGSNMSHDLAPYSNAGSIVDVVAPGGDMPPALLPLTPDNYLDQEAIKGGILVATNPSQNIPASSSSSHTYLMGTSLATPHVAGVVALMRSINSNTSPSDLENIIKQHATPVKGCNTGMCGGGELNPKESVDAMIDGEFAIPSNLTIYGFDDAGFGIILLPLQGPYSTYWGPSETQFKFQWEKNGVPVQGATNIFYSGATPDDIGSSFSLKITASYPGYLTKTKLSEPYIYTGYEY